MPLRRSRLPTSLFVGWFDPRGLASIVFAVMLPDAGLPHGNDLAGVIAGWSRPVDRDDFGHGQLQTDSVSAPGQA